MLILRINNTDIEWHSSPKERFIIDNDKQFARLIKRQSLFELFPGNPEVIIMDGDKELDKVELEWLLNSKNIYNEYKKGN